MLTNIRTQNSVVQAIDELEGLYLHIRYVFSGETTNVEVDTWLVTDVEANPLDISSLTFNEFRILHDSLVADLEYHTSLYYADLESSYYNRVG